MKTAGLLLPFLVPILWGLGGYFGGRLTQKSTNLFEGHLYITLGFIAWSILILVATGFKAVSNWQWHPVGMALGASYALGGLVFILAIFFSGSATKVVALSALYPAVTALLFFLFHGEALTLKKVIAVLLAIIVGWLSV